MTDETVLNLQNAKSSFFDELQDYTALLNQENLDPEHLAQTRLDLIKSAKREIENKTSAEAVRWYGYSLVTSDNGFPIDVDKGIGLLNEAVMMRSIQANSDLGDIYSGEGIIVPEDKINIEKAIKHYAQADNGYTNYRLAAIYIEHEVLKDVRKALDCVERSANDFGDPMGKLMLGVWKYSGELMPQSFDEAYELFNDVHESDRTQDGGYASWACVSALFFLGLMAYNGDGIQQDQELGFKMIEEAATFSDGDAIQWMQGYQEFHG